MSDRLTERERRGGKKRVAAIRLTVLEGPDRGRVETWSSDAPLSIGVSPDNGFVLNDPKVSRYHLEVRSAAGGILVRDLGSLNGTFANALRLEQAVAPPGTRVKLGDTTLALDDAGATEIEEAKASQDLWFVAVSPAMRRVCREIERLAATNVSVLIEGETGTGKELVARAVHERSARRADPFVVVDCGSLPATLVASELFGHERGSFTGAERRHEGAFELANGGTVFLDEIGELPTAVQPVLLGVLERRRFRRLGGNDEIAVDVRVVSATHRDLRAEVNRASFRSDLYFRLAATRIVIPPLRERPEDIEPLVAHFAAELLGPDAPTWLDPADLETLRGHRWTGNVRELRNVVEASLALGQLMIERPPAGAPPPPDAAPDAEAPDDALVAYSEARRHAIQRFEAAYLRSLMTSFRGNASEAARRAKMDRPYLLSLLRRHGLR
jgi:DNA-binding NtrC family response regulator